LETWCGDVAFNEWWADGCGRCCGWSAGNQSVGGADDCRRCAVIAALCPKRRHSGSGGRRPTPRACWPWSNDNRCACPASWSGRRSAPVSSSRSWWPSASRWRSGDRIRPCGTRTVVRCLPARVSRKDT